MTTSRTWVVVMFAVLGATATCKKKSEEAPAPAPVAAPAEAGASTADAGTAAAPSDAAAAEAAAAAEEAGTASPSGGGGSLLAGLFGGGRRASGDSSAPAAAASAPALEAMRGTGRALLAKEDEPAFGRAVEAAQLANDMKAAGLAAPTAAAAEPATSAPTGASVPPPPDDPDPCATLVPEMMGCLASQFGEALGADEIAEALEDCRKEFGEWPAEQQASFRGCNAVSECSAKMECIATIVTAGGDGEDIGGEEVEVVQPIELPAGADLCTKVVVRSAQCVDMELGAEELGPAVEECRNGLSGMPPQDQQRLAVCLEKGCEEMWSCMGGLDEGMDVGGGEVETGPADLFGPPPDPARVASLPAATRELCAMIPVSLERCWSAFIGEVSGGQGDPEVTAMMEGMKAELLSGIGNMCLQAALDDPDSYREMDVVRPCLTLPCDQLIQCIEEKSGQ